MFFSRGKNKHQNPYTLKHMYDDYIKDIPEDSPYFVPYMQYRAICETFFKQVMVEVLEHARSFKMPYNMGRIFVDKKKVPLYNKKKLSIDWAATNEHGKVIYHLNEHSRGYKYVFCWEKLTFRLKNKSFYRFIPSRHNKRRLAQLVKSGDYDYFSSYEGRDKYGCQKKKF